MEKLVKVETRLFQGLDLLRCEPMVPHPILFIVGRRVYAVWFMGLDSVFAGEPQCEALILTKRGLCYGAGSGSMYP